MARINSYTRDKSITTEDTLVGSSYEGTNQQGPIYKTQSYKIGDLATYLNLVFTVDEVNYNLNDMISRIDDLESDVTTINTTLSTISTHVTDNYSVVLDGTSNNFTGLKSLGGSLTDLRFTTTSFKFWDDNTSASVEIFENIGGALKIKNQYLQLEYDDIPGTPDPVEYTTVIYADNANGDNQSLSATNKNYYAFFEGTEKLTSSNFSPPYTGLEWHQLTGDPGDNATAIKLIASKYVINYSTTDTETDTINFSTIIQNVNSQDATYKFYVDGVAQTTNPTATSTFTLPDNLEPGVGAAVTVKVELYRSGILLQEDSVSIYGIKDGTDAVLAFLTNQSHVVVADNDGSVVNTNFPNAGGTFKVYVGGDDVTTQCTFTVASETGVDVSIVSGTGVYSVNSMSADEGTADFQVTIPGSVANTPNAVVRTATYSIAKSIKGDEGLRGEAGSSSRSVHLSVKPNVVTYDEYGVRETTSVLLTADPQGYSSPQYRWLKDGIEITQIPGSGATSEWTFTNTLTVPSGLMVPALATDDWEVQVRQNAQDLNPSTDVQTVYGTQAGSNVVVAVLENDTTVLSTSAAGNVNYNQSNNKIKVYKGNTPLTYIQNPSPLAEGQFTVTATGTDITPSTSISGNNTSEYLIGNASNMTQDNASIEFEIEVYGGSTNIVLTKTQTFAKAKQGEIGQSVTGPQGQRVATGVIWYDQGAANNPGTPSLLDSGGNDIYYDFDNQVFLSSPPPGWQEDAPDGEPGTSDSIYWTSRYTVIEDLDTNGDPTGEGTPSFATPIRAMVFNQVVVFQSTAPNHGYTQIDGGYIKTVNIRSLNYTAPLTGQDFAQSGTLIDLQNSKITSKYLVLDNTGLKINGDGNFTGDITGASGTFTGSLTGASGTFGGVTISSSGLSSSQFSIDASGNASFEGSLDVGTVVIDNGYIQMQSNSATLEGTIQFVDSSSVSSGAIYASNTSGSRGININSTDDTFLSTGTTGASIHLRGSTASVSPNNISITSGGSNGVTDINNTLTVNDLKVVGDILQPNSPSYTNSDYQIIPGGLIVQWVRVTGSGTLSGSWPTQFPNYFLGAVISTGNQTSTYAPENNAKTVSGTTTNYYVDMNETYNTNAFIIAFGY